MLRLPILLTICALSSSAQSFDVVVYGATPGGIGAAITAARAGHTVALIEPQNHIGGMTAGGLSRSDIQTRAAIGGIYREFAAKVYRYYVDRYGAESENAKLSDGGYMYEPHVAEKILMDMIAAEPRIRLYVEHRLDKVSRAGRRLTAMSVRQLASGRLENFQGRVFIDGTYEGDLPWRPAPATA